jgi:hypothetical protein
MTREDALHRAEDCARLAEINTDPDRAAVLRHMEKMWRALAVEAIGAASIDADFARLLTFHSDLVARSQTLR